MSDLPPTTTAKVQHFDPAKLQLHPAAAMFPPLRPTQLKRLAAQIKRKGCKPIVLDRRRRIVEGQNRWLACQQLGIPVPAVRLLLGVDPVEFALTENLDRRQMTKSQLACVAMRWLAEQSAEMHSTDVLPTAEEVSRRFGFSRRYFFRAQGLLEDEPELFAAVFRGEKTLTAACQEMDGPADDTEFEFERMWRDTFRVRRRRVRRKSAAPDRTRPVMSKSTRGKEQVLEIRCTAATERVCQAALGLPPNEREGLIDILVRIRRFARAKETRPRLERLERRIVLARIGG